MLFALATSHKIGLALAAAAFVVFALISALWLPRLRPDFPGPKLKAFLAACVVITLVMLGAVIALAKEPEEKEAATPTETSVAATTGGPAKTTPAPAPTGNPANGKTLFAAQGCAACHTFTPAGSKATIGPDLDKLAADAQKASRGPLPAYVKESIVDPNAYVVPRFPKGVMPQDFGMKLSPSQLNDLVAFLAAQK